MPLGKGGQYTNGCEVTAARNGRLRFGVAALVSDYLSKSTIGALTDCPIMTFGDNSAGPGEYYARWPDNGSFILTDYFYRATFDGGRSAMLSKNESNQALYSDQFAHFAFNGDYHKKDRFNFVRIDGSVAYATNSEYFVRRLRHTGGGAYRVFEEEMQTVFD